MEKRKDSLGSIRLCRFCLSQDKSLTSLYDRSREPKNSVPLALKILSCVSIEVFPSDKMPAYICSRCKFFMDLSYDYKQICRKGDETIMQYIQNGASLEPVNWSASLNKIFRNGAKPTEVGIMKTVIEGGATVQVTAQELSESEEDDAENVYNVKVGDGSDDGSKSARVKVITGDENESAKGKAKRARKGLSTISKLARHVRSHAGERPYPCKYCEKSFMKSHHYTRHLRLKHRETIRSPRGPFGEAEQYRCEQCEDSFASQDDLIYHSAIHATQNLTCPLCQEKFPNVDAVTSHIKSHVNGIEFMCDYCELVFTCKEKLDLHLASVHDDEIHSNDVRQDETSNEVDAEEDNDIDDDDNSIDVKEEDGHMVVEIKKANNFMLTSSQDETEDKLESVNSEDSEPEVTYTELETVETTATMKKGSARDASVKLSSDVTIVRLAGDNSNDAKTATILKKAEQIKRKGTNQQATEATVPEKPKEKSNSKGENSNSGASDKSLRLLEKELQDLKRTNTPSNTRSEAVKPVTTLRSKRPQIHTSTPKLRSIEEKKSQVTSKSPVPEKKIPERRVLTKENKEPKEVKETRNNIDVKDDKETPKSVVKNGASDKNPVEDGVRRSTRPSKIKDYAKMIRDSSSQESDDNDDDSDDGSDDDEYKEVETEIKTKGRRPSLKPAAKPTPASSPATATATRKRGRPRKDQVIAKLRKEESEEQSPKADKNDSQDGVKETENKNSTTENSITESKTPVIEPKPTNTIVSPTGQMLKKVPIKSLPPGVKPLPLPVNARQMGSGEVCEMQIGKKVVKVQKIVMTKAEVEAMAKKGLVEMKDGTMVLKQGIKIPTADPTTLKSSLVGDGEASKESLIKKDKAAPMRCDLGDEA